MDITDADRCWLHAGARAAEGGCRAGVRRKENGAPIGSPSPSGLGAFWSAVPPRRGLARTAAQLGGIVLMCNVFTKSVYSEWPYPTRAFDAVSVLDYESGIPRLIRNIDRSRGSFPATCDEVNNLTIAGDKLFDTHDHVLAYMDLNTRRVYNACSSHAPELWGGVFKCSARDNVAAGNKGVWKLRDTENSSRAATTTAPSTLTPGITPGAAGAKASGRARSWARSWSTPGFSMPRPSASPRPATSPGAGRTCTTCGSWWWRSRRAVENVDGGVLAVAHAAFGWRAQRASGPGVCRRSRKPRTPRLTARIWRRILGYAA